MATSQTDECFVWEEAFDFGCERKTLSALLSRCLILRTIRTENTNLVLMQHAHRILGLAPSYRTRRLFRLPMGSCLPITSSFEGAAKPQASVWKILEIAFSVD